MRKAEIKRKTNETDIYAEINLDGRGVGKIDTGIGFLDHMLALFARHGRFDLTVKCTGDLQVDGHHTVEDWVSAWERSFCRLWERKGGSAAMDLPCFRWMKH